MDLAINNKLLLHCEAFTRHSSVSEEEKPPTAQEM